MWLLQAARIEKDEVSYLQEGFPEAVGSVLRFADITVEILLGDRKWPMEKAITENPMMCDMWGECAEIT